MNEMERKIINKMDSIEEILYQNKSWIELLRGYCKNVLEDIEEFENLIQPLGILLQNNKILLHYLEDLSDNYFKEFIKSYESK